MASIIAADHGARVINLSVVMYADVPAVRPAVAYAQDKAVVVVAAVGNAHSDTGVDPTPYPAVYSGVLGVGAITIDGSRWLPASQVGPYVDLVAPGGCVLAATREHGQVFWDGTSFATPLVRPARTRAALRRAADAGRPAAPSCLNDRLSEGPTGNRNPAGAFSLDGSAC